jgi:thioesterase domain-containing protein
MNNDEAIEVAPSRFHSLPAFLTELRKRDIHLSAEGDRLRCNAPTGALTLELRKQLRQRKGQILEFLRTAQEAEQHEAIVTMQPSGMRVPVFACPGHNGDVFAFRDLARHLGNEQPFFVLQPPGLDGRREPIKRVEDLASYFASQIEAFRPNGEYVIAGYCTGGATAFELARQLRQRGASIVLIALFGCIYPTLYRFSVLYWVSRVVKHAQALMALRSFQDGRRYVAERFRQRLKAIRDQRTPAALDPISLLRFNLEQTTLAAMRRYSPKQYSGRVCLFLPNREWLRAGGAALRWRTVAPDSEEYYGPDSCDPGRMLLEPDAPAFAELFRNAMQHRPNEAVADQSSSKADS